VCCGEGVGGGGGGGHYVLEGTTRQNCCFWFRQGLEKKKKKKRGNGGVVRAIRPVTRMFGGCAEVRGVTEKKAKRKPRSAMRGTGWGEWCGVGWSWRVKGAGEKRVDLINMDGTIF